MRGGVSAKRLRELLQRFSATPVLVAGDIILDRYIWGKVDRISPEAPVVVVQVTNEDQRLGGAANVVRNLRELGASVSLCGVVGDDESGRNVVRLLQELGVEHQGVISDPSRTTTIKTRVIADHQQVVRIDREVLRPLDEDVAGSFARSASEVLAGKAARICSRRGSPSPNNSSSLAARSAASMRGLLASR